MPVSDDGKLRKKVARGKQTENLWNNPILQDAFEAIETDLVNGWKDSDGSEKEQRENAYFLLRALEELKSRLKRIIREGNDAQTELSHKEGK